MKQDALTDYAHRLAYTRPARGIGAKRVREPFRVERVWDEGARYIGLSVAIDDGDFLASHVRPGQYTTFQYGEMKPRFLAIASAPKIEGVGESCWDFLIDRDSGLGAQLSEVNGLKVGRKILLSPAEGAGFPAEGAAQRSVLLFCTGAGIASLRPVMQYWHAHPEAAPANVALYYGESDLRDFAYGGEIAKWRAGGVRVQRAVENFDEAQAATLPPNWISPGHRYVQHAFEADAPSLKGAMVFVSGSPIMMEIIIEKMLRLGVSSDSIYINV
ncbi:FAD-dependent oxidoreductase [Bradymonas sediminis]|uniref:FAD-dependent oxidoreductase n=1 Tax=Bradymonas sediminis TaxID=1548548 RepID=UPI0010EC3AF5|nr:FAD-dependent oxidoreductase [Bradymonas sediminis]TDP62620.1 NAD(P)H-flavin reductase [Bradymonas sediminis]